MKDSLICGWMDNRKVRGFFLLFLLGLMLIIFVSMRIPTMEMSIPQPHPPHTCPLHISKNTITPLNNTKHFLVSAYIDRRTEGFDIRIISLFRRDSIQPLHCVFCCVGHMSPTSPAQVFQHSDNFGFPFVTTDVMCRIPENCNATHVTLQTSSDRVKVFDDPWLPIRNYQTYGIEEKKMPFNFTVCISNLFAYNNVLQFAQSLEMYRLLGVDRVVIYNTSCEPELNRLLQGYIEEGFLEVVPWPIDQHMTPSRGWLHSLSGGDVHYFGQLTTLNECIYRSMDRSRYVLLNDIDEIIMPYQHNNLMSLMDMLRQQQQWAGVFLIENHIFPKTHFEPSGQFHLPQWNTVPGVNILEHIYREDPDRRIYHPHKMILRPRMVKQTSVHEVLSYFGQVYNVPMDVCRIIHVRGALRGSLKLEELNVDKRLWDFSEKLIARVDKVLARTGFLDSEEQS